MLVRSELLRLPDGMPVVREEEDVLMSFEIKNELVDCPVLDCDGRLAYELDGKTYCCSDPRYFCQRKRMAIMAEEKSKNLKCMKIIVALTALVFVINVAAFVVRIMGV